MMNVAHDTAGLFKVERAHGGMCIRCAFCNFIRWAGPDLTEGETSTVPVCYCDGAVEAVSAILRNKPATFQR